MLRAARALLLLFAGALLCAPMVRGQNDPQAPGAPTVPAPPQGRPLDATTVKALERLTELMATKRTERDAAKQAGGVDRAEALETEVRELGWQFSGLASGLDVQQFEAPTSRQFDVKAEIEDLVRPLVQALKDATEGPRQISELKARIKALEARQSTAETAQRGVERTRDALPEASPARAEAERELAERWQPALVALRGEILVLQAQLLAREQVQVSLVDRVSSSTDSFLKSSGVTLLLAAAVFVTVLLSLRWLQNRLMRRRKADRGFSLRLLEVSLSALTMVLTVGATLIVPYLLNDWLLLAIGIVFLVGVGWVLVRMLPQFFEQIRLVLNVGSVREGERIVLDGLPYRVDQLRFYSRLTNPDLQGGELRVPIQELIGKRSRRSAPNEAWFPCRAGEVVMLADGVVGPVLAQSPGGVAVDNLGAPRSYSVGDFLAQKPRNLSRGFWLDTMLSIDYRHQAEATTVIPQRLKEALLVGLTPLVPQGQLLGTDVQFAAASENALSYVALATFTGEAALLFPDLRRAMQRVLVEACGANGWSIQPTKIVEHRQAE